MRKAANLGLTLVFGLVASVSVLACEPPAPGQTSTPPCIVQTASDQSVVDNTGTPPDSTDLVITEAAIGLLQGALLLF